MSGRTLNVFFRPKGAGLATLPNAPGVFISEWQSIDQETGFAIQADYDASITGTLTVQGRLAGMDPVELTEVNAQIAAIAASAGSQLINVVDAMFHEFRVTYSHTSGLGVLSVGGHVKGA